MVIAVEKGEEVDGEIAFVVVGQRADDAEIEGDVAVVGGDQNITRVHIGMEKAVAEDLCEEDFHAVIGKFVQIDAVGFEFGDFRYGRAVHPFDGQHVAGAVVVKHFRHNQHIAVLEVAASLFEIYSISPFFKMECFVTLSATLVRFVGDLDVDVYRV